MRPPNPDDFEYALENTRLIVAPRGRIATFGSTSFRFQLVSELMDRASDVRIRAGSVEAERPQILTPDRLARLLLEGFGERAQEFADRLSERARRAAPGGGQALPVALRYGFHVRRSTVTETVVAGEGLERVTDRLRAAAEAADDPLCAVVQGVDDAWEICLLTFALDLINQSAAGNLGDLRGRGLI